MWKTVITPSFGDADPLRHINNCILPYWFETGREAVFRVIHPTMDYDSWPMILARISVDYVSQMKFGLDVEIRTFIKKFGRTSFTIYQEAWQNGALGAKGDAVIVYFDYQTQKPCPLPAEVAKKLEKHLVDPENPNLRTRSGRFPAAGR